MVCVFEGSLTARLHFKLIIIPANWDWLEVSKMPGAMKKGIPLSLEKGNAFIGLYSTYVL